MVLIFINDDEAIVAMLNAVFSESPKLQGIQCRAVQCRSYETAMRAIERIRPEIIFLDNQLSRGGSEGLEIAKSLKTNPMGVKKIISTTQDVDMVEEYAKLGIPHVQIFNFTSIESAVLNHAAFDNPG